MTRPTMEELRAEVGELLAHRERITNETHDTATREVLSRFNFAPFTSEERTVLMAKEIVALQSRCDTARAALERVREVAEPLLNHPALAALCSGGGWCPHCVGARILSALDGAS